MSGKAARRAPMISLREVVERYATLAGNFGEPVALAAFGLSPEETAGLFSSLDEDYHISRFLHFARSTGPHFLISGERVTHIAIDPAIYSLL
jgi:hypothetical protein